VAAASAGVKTYSLHLLIAEDPEFSTLVDAFRAIKTLPPEAKRARLVDLCWDGAERAILDGRVSTLNLCLRSLRLIEAEEEVEEEDPMEAFLAGLSPEERADYEALGEVEQPDLSPIPVPPADAEPPGPSPLRGWPGHAGPKQDDEADLATSSLSPDRIEAPIGQAPALSAMPAPLRPSPRSAPQSTPFLTPASEPVPSWLRQRFTGRAPQGP
jgi:hypothetical protein